MIVGRGVEMLHLDFHLRSALTQQCFWGLVHSQFSRNLCHVCYNVAF